jgi:membrane protease YdiL (CAAX protease family)
MKPGGWPTIAIRPAGARVRLLHYHECEDSLWNSDQRRWRLRFAILYAGLGLFFGAYALNYFRRYPLGWTPKAAIFLCLMLLLGLALAPGFPAPLRWLRERVRGARGAAWCMAAFLLPYLLYSAGTGDFRWPAFGKLLAISALPFGLFAAAPVRRPERFNWQDAVVLLWLVLPVLFGKAGGIWNVPQNLDFMVRLFLLGVGSWSYLIARKVEGSGYEFRLGPASALDLLVRFAGFAAIALPLGFGTRFIAWNPQFRGAWPLVSDYATIFLFIAVLEELFFRGLLQNLLEGSLRSRYLAQGVAAVIFGLSHIRHAPSPNWRYVAMATVAGWFYGSAYRNHRSLMASSALHALVDTLWRTWFTLPKF